MRLDLGHPNRRVAFAQVAHVLPDQIQQRLPLRAVQVTPTHPGIVEHDVVLPRLRQDVVPGLGDVQHRLRALRLRQRVYKCQALERLVLQDLGASLISPKLTPRAQ